MTDGVGDVAELRRSVAGAVLRPADAEYDAARRGFNALIDRRPALVARCAGGGDVAAALDFARTHALEDGVVYHAYSTYDRGTDALNATWQLLDRAPKGRDDENHPDWPRLHDEY